MAAVDDDEARIDFRTGAPVAAAVAMTTRVEVAEEDHRVNWSADIDEGLSCGIPDGKRKLPDRLR